MTEHQPDLSGKALLCFLKVGFLLTTVMCRAVLLLHQLHQRCQLGFGGMFWDEQHTDVDLVIDEEPWV